MGKGVGVRARPGRLLIDASLHCAVKASSAMKARVLGCVVLVTMRRQHEETKKSRATVETATGEVDQVYKPNVTDNRSERRASRRVTYVRSRNDHDVLTCIVLLQH